MHAPHFTPRLRIARCPALAVALAAATFGGCDGYSSGTTATPAARAAETAARAAETAGRAAETAGRAAETAAAVGRLGWMAGCWERRAGDLHVEEQWIAPSGGTMTGVGRTVRRGRTPELMTGLAGAAHRAGVPFVTGTDYYVDGDESFPSVHREIEYLVDQRVLSPLEAITAATLNGAHLLDLADTHGSIAPGMAASLVVLAEDPSLDIRALWSVVTVLHRGEWYPRDARTLSP